MRPAPGRPQRPDPRRILVIRRKALGDALVGMPAVLQLAAAFPAARIDLVVDRPFAPLLSRFGGRIGVLAWPPPQGGSTIGWISRLRSNGYDLVLDLLGSPRTAAWTFFSGAPLRVGYDLRLRRWAYNLRVPRNRRDGFDLRQFAGESFLDPLREMGLVPPPWTDGGLEPPPPQDLDPSYRRWRDGWLDGPGPRVGLMLSATWPAKAWPAANAAELTGLLRAKGIRALLIRGPGDDRIQEAVLRADPEAEAAPATGLLELADLLARIDVWAGTDCGARHLARAVGTPTVTLFGPTDPAGWNPQDPRHVAVRNAVECSPCDLTECPVPGHPCLDGLKAAAVGAEIESLLGPTGGSGRPDRRKRP